MKKTFRFLALSLMMLGGTMISWAASVSVKPADGTFVGQTVSGGVVKYQVVPGTAIDYKAKNAQGDEVDVTAYPVEISGLDYDGLTAKNLTKLNIATSFTEKYGEALNGYYVIRIVDTQGTDANQPDYKKAFYAMTQLEELTFAADANGLKDDKFTFSVGNYSFYGCTALKTLEFPDNVDKIGKYAFQNTAITSFVIPAKTETIGACAFNDTRKLGTVTVSEKGNKVLKTIDKQVFANSFVSTLDLSNAIALESINDEAFIFNASDVNAQLKSVTLPDCKDADNKPISSKFASLGANGTCFANCMALAEIKNFDRSIVEDINPGAFQNCVKLAQLDCPATVSINTNGITSPFLNTPLLKKITFAGGWGFYDGSEDVHAEEIQGGVYASTDGKKIKYNSATKKYELEDYTLTAEDKAEELKHLEEIEFKGKVYGDIADNAFGNTVANAACSGLKTVTFGGLICQGVTIGTSAFGNCAALATVTFNGFEIENGKNDNIVINNDAFMGTAIAAVDFKGFTFVGNATVSTISINQNAFACDQLASVNFGNITYKEWLDGSTWTAGPAHEFTLANGAFVSDQLKKVVFGEIVNDDTHEVNEGKGVLTIGSGMRVFAPKTITNGVLEEVEFGKMVTGAYTINNNAFRSEVLKKVKFADVTTVLDEDGSLEIKQLAFGYATVANPNNRKANLKEVEFENIVETFTAPKSNTLTVHFGNQAFFGDLLQKVTFKEIGAAAFTIGTAGTKDKAPFGGDYAEKSVTIGNITSENFTIMNGSFAGDLLKSVTIGNIVNDGPTAASIEQLAFANTSDYDDPTVGMTETVSIGALNNSALSIAQDAFRGPSQDGSVFNVTIKAAEADANKNYAGFAADAAIAAGAFAGPSVGTTSYTIGDIDATTGIAAGAFVGSKDEEGNPATTVTVGNFNKQFPNYYTFTNVNDLTAASWNDASYISKIGTPVTMTVEGNVTKNLWGDKGDNTIVSLEIGGNVASPATINDFGKKVRRIAFTSEDPQVIAGAIKKGAFEAASDDADEAETIAVIYRVKTAKNSNAIFEKEAFNDADDGIKNVVLYTDEWSLANTFRNVEIGGAAEQVYRIQLSTSAVAPGEDIKATCVKGANGKYSYGRLYVPAGTGMRYKVSAEYDEATKKNGVNLFSATISGTDIYMNTVTVMDGFYWIDATESAQTLIVRTSDVSADKVTVEAEFVTEDEAQAMDAEGSVILATDWFDATSAKKNALKYATSAITPAEFQNDASTYNKGIYVMANPAKNNLAFAKYNQTDTSTKDLVKGSVYVVTRANQYARLNVIWPEDIDEESDATAIQKVENDSEANDAIYNLQGVRVKNAQKGLYIINGKKVIK